MRDTLDKRHTLYICYFGLREPLVQTQVVPYLLELIKDGIKVTLLTFEPNLSKRWSPGQIVSHSKLMAAKGIEWHCLAYHKRPSAIATAYDIFRGAWFIRGLIGRGEIDILHGRVHMPTLMGAIARRVSRRKPKLLFDIRGFFPEEYTDAGVWPENGWLFRSAKRVERWLLRVSDGFVVLTEKARDILFEGSRPTGRDSSGRPVEVIPCCVDFTERFSADRGVRRDIERKQLGLDDRFVVVHLGALGGLYLTDEIVDFMAVARQRDNQTFGLVLTQTDTTAIRARLIEKGFAESDFLIKKVEPSDVPGYLYASDVALSFVKSSFATQSRSPTKIPEYLASGVPLIANAGVGDVDDLIAEHRVGALIDSFSEQSYLAALGEIDELRKAGDLETRCRETAIVGFDLSEVGGKRYGRLYERLLSEGK